MSSRRILTLAQRVILQVIRDRRTVALLVLAPILILTLGAILFRSEPAPVPLGVVDQDRGIVTPQAATIKLGERLTDALAWDGNVTVLALSHDEVDDRLRDGTVVGVVILPEDFTTHFVQNRLAVIDLRLEGSNPTRSTAITARVMQAAMGTLAVLAEAGFGDQSAASAGDGEATLPVSMQTTYLYGGEQFDTMDFVAPAYIGFLAMFFVFLLACVAFLRERSQGTMERLAATPATRIEIVLGYMLGLGLFALMQVVVILLYTVWVLGIHHRGSLGLMFLAITLLAVGGVTLGILASAFARTEFQVLQFIPIVIIPQVLLGGSFWAVNDMPKYLRPFAHAMPLYYANNALRDVMLKGWGLPEIWPDLGILAGFAAVLAVLSALMMRREVA